ncbi:MAG: hypothetical protein MUC98_12775 [Desulfobacterota bacterium]|nr:hypothetical protein [Thermodesulfobacteriota bacterium]
MARLMSMENEPGDEVLLVLRRAGSTEIKPFQTLQFVLEKPQAMNEVNGMNEEQGLGAVKA